MARAKTNHTQKQSEHIMNIRPEITDLSIDITTVTPHPRNIRQGDVGAICQSLESHGQYRPIVVQRSTGHVLAGNHTLAAARSLGWSQIAATYVECDDEHALRILIVDNRANDLATYDDTALSDLLQELAATDLGLDGTLFDGDALDTLIDKIASPLTLDMADAIGNLPTGDRQNATQMTFTLTLDQAEQVKDALAKSKKRHHFEDTDNLNSNGNGLWAICDEWQRQIT